MVDRSTGYCIPIMVGNNRTAANLEPIIELYILTGPDEREEDGEGGTIIVHEYILTDGGGYNKLEELGYSHWVVNHALDWGFGHWTTNRIEGFWSVIKRVCVFNEGFNCDSIQASQTELDRGNWIIQRNRQNVNLVNDLVRMILVYKQENPEFAIIF